jgi:hypothetical protein
VCFISIVHDPRPVNVARPDAFRPVCEQGNHFIPNFATCFLSTCGKNFELLQCKPVLEFDCTICCIDFKLVFVCARTVLCYVKNYRKTPSLLVPARRVNGHVAQICVSALHNLIVMRVHRFQRFGRWLNRGRLISKPVCFDQATYQIRVSVFDANRNLRCAFNDLPCFATRVARKDTRDKSTITQAAFCQQGL